MKIPNIFNRSSGDDNAVNGAQIDPLLVTPGSPAIESQLATPAPGANQPTIGLTLPTPTSGDTPNTSPLGNPLDVPGPKTKV